jgi:hypothetical protein
MTLQGELVRKFEIPSAYNESLAACCISNHEEFLFSLTESGKLYCFEFLTGKMLKIMETGSKRAKGMTMHPTKNILACYFQGGDLKTFRPP